jgi:formamidopyrimidine-DNA glycosylase
MLRQSLRRTERCLKAILLDQTVVAGVGNIYADEALFEAKLHPQRRGCDVKPAEAERLRAAIVTVLNRAIQRKGSTILNFFYGEGQQGSFQNEFKVYQQTGEPCPRCDRAIHHVRLAGRSTHFCPRCQRPPRLPQA